MNNRERFHAIMNFQPFDRLPVVELAIWWDKTIERWQQEGLPKEWDRNRDKYKINEHFGLDDYNMCEWFHNLGPATPKPAHHGAPLIWSEQDYEKIRPTLYPWPAIDEEFWAEWAEKQARGEAVISFNLIGYFFYPRQLFGIEPHLMAFYDCPELMHRINSDTLEYHLRLIERFCEICAPDYVMIAEDLSYNKGPMLSKNLFEQFLKPYYERLVPKLHETGALVMVDSDGDITETMPWFEEVGVDGLFPLERQCGVDVAELREKHPGMRFFGHYNKRVMSRGEEAMRSEFERLLPIAARGGYTINCDHQTPPEVSYQDYLLYLKLFREYADIVGRKSREIA